MIVSYSHFAYNWQNRFWDSGPIVARFPSNKWGNLDIWISRTFAELLPPHVCVLCHVRGLGPSHMLKQNVLSLNLLILLVDLTNQKRGICRHRILYPLRLGLPFSNDGKILKSKVGLGPDQIEIDLRKIFYGKYNSFISWIKLFLERKKNVTKTLGHAYVDTCMCTHAPDLRTHASCIRAHTWACVHMLGF